MFHPMNPGVSQDVAIGSTSAASANPISSNVFHVRLVATSACYVAIGDAPTAAKPGGMRLAPNFPEIFRVVPGQSVAVIQDAAAGTLTVTEMLR
jgi:hypothetical protein